jgi:hypothetical protein
MPRMSKSKKLEWSFFLNGRGRKAYNTLAAASTIASRVSGRLSLFARIINPRGQKRVVHLRTPLADPMERHHEYRRHRKEVIRHLYQD